jgi:hypothetical protein
MLHIDWLHVFLDLLIGDRPFVNTTSPTDPEKCYNAGYSEYEKDVSFPLISVFQPMLEG